MSEKYKFDPENFNIHEETKKQKIIKLILAYILSIIFIALAVYLVLSYSVETPVEKNLKAQNKLLRAEYNRLYSQYLENQKKIKILQKQDINLYKIIFASAPMDDSLSIPDYKVIHGRKAIKKAKENNEILQEMYSKMKSERTKFIAFVDSLKTTKVLDSIPAILPIPKTKSFQIYGYGQKLDPTYHIPRFHIGMDFKAPFGTPVFATADGIIVTAKRDRLKGNYVVIKHGEYTTIYSHLDKKNVRPGMKIKRGQVIGYIGSTGKSLIEHLHYEVKYKDKNVNPIFYLFLSLNPKEFKKYYKMSTNAGISLD